MNSNADEFLLIFNKMEKLFREMLGKRDSFKRLIDEASKTNSIVRNYKEILHSYRELRNVIVHEKTEPTKIIADPREETVNHFREIYEELTNPPLVIPRFQQDVKTFDIGDLFIKVLEEVQKFEYSQFPIYNDEQFVGLLTTNGITNALANNFNHDEGGFIIFTDTKIKNILTYEEIKSNYKFIPRDYNIYDIVEIFAKSSQQGERLEAILITQHGKETEQLLGIITIWDIMQLQKEKRLRA